MVVLVRNLIRVMIRDRDTVNKIFESMEHDSNETHKEIIKASKSGQKIDTLSYLAHLNDEKMSLMRLIDALMIDAIENRETVRQLIESIKSPKPNESTLKDILRRLEQQESEAKDFREKHGRNLDWVRKFFEKDSKTSLE